MKTLPPSLLLTVISSVFSSPPHWGRILRGGDGTYSPGEPVYDVVPPGRCQFGEDWSTCKLLKVEACSPDTKVFTFALPDGNKPLNLPTCGCLLVSGGRDSSNDGEPFVRPYTPVSTNNLVGKVELMVKIYPGGNLSRVFGEMNVGDELDFKHTKFNVKKQYADFKNKNKNICMIVGGTGITPMIQALHAILGNPNDDTKVTMLYGSRTQDSIIARETLRKWSDSSGGQLTVIDVLSAEPEGSDWEGRRGFVDGPLIRENFPGCDCPLVGPPLVFVCGPPAMYEAVCGPREEAEVKGVLGEMGFGEDMVVKF